MNLWYRTFVFFLKPKECFSWTIEMPLCENVIITFLICTLNDSNLPVAIINTGHERVEIWFYSCCCFTKNVFCLKQLSEFLSSLFLLWFLQMLQVETNENFWYLLSFAQIQTKYLGFLLFSISSSLKKKNFIFEKRLYNNRWLFV